MAALSVAEAQESPALKFVGKDPYSRDSECGGFRISKVIVLGRARYEALAKSDGRWIWLGTMFHTFEQASAVCQRFRGAGRGA